MEDSKTNARPPRDALGIGFGLFLVLAGALTLAENAGWISALKWGAPVFWTVVGSVIFYKSLRTK
ncbi:MAG: hypothetical protein JWP60_4114 [Ramlibacter sp.]|nr:hypothetical protein [Ramlibacter sp.]